MRIKPNHQGLWLLAVSLCTVFLFPAFACYAQVASSAPPNLSLSVNEGLGHASFAGWPLVFKVELFHPDAMTVDEPVSPMLLETATGSWADAVRITVLDSSGVQQNWPLHLLLRPTGQNAAISLDSETSGLLTWWVSPADTSSIPPGTYRVFATLDTTAGTDPNAYAGQATSGAVTISLASEPPALLPDDLARKLLLFAFYDVLQGNNSQALAEIDSLLAAQPQNLAALEAKGDLLQQAGDAAGALAVFDQAVAAFYAATPDPPEPPVELLERSASLRSASLSQAGAVPEPDVGIQLQNSSLQAPGVYALDLRLTNTGPGDAHNFSISQITFATLQGTGQAGLNTGVPPQLPASVDVLRAGASATLHFSVLVPAGIGSFSAAESGTVRDILGTSFAVSGSQTVSTAVPSLAITSAGSVTFQVGVPGSFTVTSAGSPAAAISESGPLPAGVTFADNGDGTGTLGGTPGAATAGTYPVIFRASNGVGTDAVQSFTLTVVEAASITSANSVTFAVGSAGLFTVTASGFPAPSLSLSGRLPGGVSFDGISGTLSGTPAMGTGGVYPITLLASNGVGAGASQNFTLTVTEAPGILSAGSATFTVGTAGSFIVTAAGYPRPSLSEAGTLPGGLAFDPATGVLSGTPAAGMGGIYSITFAAASTAGSARQSFVLTIQEAPSITSAGTATFTLGTAGSFRVTSRGFPTPALTETGALPAGIGFSDNGDGTGTLSGTPGASGTFNLSFAAGNGVGSAATQDFTLIVPGSGGPIASVTPAAVNFGHVALFHIGLATLTLRNSGANPLKISSISLALGPGTDRDDFFHLSFCGSSLAAGKSCPIFVFYLADDPGTDTATLNIADNDPSGIQSVSLTGTAVKKNP